jgi:ABC-type glycerol-3-phosphate transport system permease component
MILGGIASGAVFPLFWMVSGSLRPWSELFANPPLLFPRALTFRFYRDVFQYTSFFVYLQNSLIVASGTTFVGVSFACLAAYSLARKRFRGSAFLHRAILLAYLFPSIILIIPLFVVFTDLGLINTRSGLVLAYSTFSFPFCTWLLAAYFRGIPKEIEEAAAIDGATHLTVLIRIYLPLAAPAIVTAAIFTFILAWNEFVLALILATKESLKTLSIGFYGRVYSGDMAMAWGTILAWAALMVLPPLLFFMIIEKRLVEGLTGGAVKG